MLPTTLKRFFWDARFDTINQEVNKSYVISRLMELGDEVAVKWLETSYSADDLKQVVGTTKVLSPKSLNYWKLRYSLA